MTFETFDPRPNAGSSGCSKEDRVEPTNDQDPSYYHRVVDCQWACPAHTNVPG
ncbi:hypothetical protein B1B_15301, partial [mine drainage metagenome]